MSTMGSQAALVAVVIFISVCICLAQYQQPAPQYQQPAPAYQAPQKPAYQAPQYPQPQYAPQPYQQKSPYGNYSSGASMYGNYTKTPQYPPVQYNSTAKYQNASASYNVDPFAWWWDHEHQSRHVYDQEAQRWIYANIQAAYDWAVYTFENQNNGYSGYGQSCGYTGNPYGNTYELRNSKRAQLLVLMAQYLWDTYPLYPKQILIPAMLNINAYNLNIPGIQDCLAENYGQYQGTCDVYQKYSRPDQVCNNIAFPQWGAWLDIGVRITDIWNYQNGIWVPTQYNVWPSYDGTLAPLIDAKYLANALDGDTGQCYNFDVTNLHAYFTQFIAHDVIKSAPYTVTGYNGVQVKPECCKTPDNCLHHTCDAYKGPGTSDGYNTYPSCESFSLNLPGIDYCTPLPKDQTNQQTAYVDCSQVYGASCYDAAKLRAFRKGKLRVNRGMYGLYAKNVLLPDDPSPSTDDCDISYPDGNLRCLMSGDTRVNMHPGMLALHTLWLRMHNRVSSSCAKWLEKYYLSDDVLDEICYQETRRIVQAVTQNIFYRDHMPVELGPYISTNPNYGLGLDYVLPYDPAAHASIWPEYAYAAGRLHSSTSHWTQVVDPIKAAQGLQEPDNWYGIYDWFKKGYALMYNKNKLNELISNSLYDPQQCYDTDFVPEMRNVNPQYGGPGIDMFWTNIKRGREFGLPWYTQVREWCGLGYLDDFSQLQGIWTQKCLNLLPGLVGHVKNVELYIGLLCENILPGASVGPTAACLKQRQYYNLREGDRWFFDRNGFTRDQMAVVKKFNLGKILCITTNLDYVTENVFRTPNSYTNKYQSCNAYDDITEDDLSVLWSTIPYATGDYRTCKEYGGYQSPQYQNATYSAPQYKQNSTYQQPAPQYKQNNTYAQPQQTYQQPAPVYQQQQPAYQQMPAYPG